MDGQGAEDAAEAVEEGNVNAGEGTVDVCGGTVDVGGDAIPLRHRCDLPLTQLHPRFVLPISPQHLNDIVVAMAHRTHKHTQKRDRTERRSINIKIESRLR